MVLSEIKTIVALRIFTVGISHESISHVFWLQEKGNE
jgi:hypothetical protein